MKPLLALVLLLAAFAALVWFDNAANRGITFVPEPPPVAGGSGPTLGVNLFNIHLEPDQAAVRRSFELAAALGAGYARMQVPWDDLEIHARGDFEDRRNLEAVGAVSAWAKYDRLVSEANAAGVELIWRLERPPAWARERIAATPEFQAGLERDGNSTGPPDDLADYANFVRTVVERYDGDGIDDAPGSPTVRHFQIWNEPNLKNEWNWQEPRPEDFVELLRVGATAARAANPNAVIIFPGLAPTDGLDASAPMTELAYLARVYQAGGAAYFDVMAAQAYGLGQPPDEHRYVFLRGRGNWSWRRPIDTRNDVSRVVLLREVMEAHGDAGTPIWVTEFGWNSAPDSIPPERRLTWGVPVDEATKGAYLVGQLERARDEWPWMGVMNVWMLRYGGYAEPNPDDPTPYFALVTRDWQVLPAYEALRAFSVAPPVMGVGVHAWAHPAVEALAGGGWRVRFSGTRLLLLGGLDAEAGPVSGLLDESEGGLERVLYNGQRAFATPLLPDGVYTLEIQGGPAPELLLVERARPWGLLWDYGPLALLGLLAVAGAASFAALGPLLKRGLTWLGAVQQQTRGNTGLGARLIQPASLITLGLLLGVIIAYRGSAQLPITLMGLLLFAGLAVVRPDLGLLFVPLTVPLYFIPKGLFDARFGIRDSGIYLPMHEVLLLLVTLAAALRLGMWASQSMLLGRPKRPHPLSPSPASRRGGTQAHSSAMPGQQSDESVQVLNPQLGEGELKSAVVAKVGELEHRPAKSELEQKSGFHAFSFILHPSSFILFLAAALWGVLIAEARGPALRELRWMVIEPLLLVGLAWLLAGWHARRGGGDYWLLLVRVWLLGGALAGLVGLLQFGGLNLAPLFGTKAGFSADSFVVEGVRRVSGLYGHPNNLGLAMGRYWPVAAALAHLAFWGALQRHESAALPSSPVHQFTSASRQGVGRAWPYALAATLCLGALLASFSRGAYLGALAAAAVLAWALLPAQIWRERRLWWAGGLLAGALLLALGAAIALGVERLNPLGATSGVRLQTWASALVMLRDHPLGVGLDQFGRYYPQYIAPELAATNELNTAHPHNLGLDVALRMGPLGLLAFGWLIVRFYRGAWQTVRAGGDGLRAAPSGPVLVAGAAAAMTASLVHGLVDQFYFWPDLALAFWLLIALERAYAGRRKAAT